MTNRAPDLQYDSLEQVVPWAIEQWVRLNLNTSMPGVVRKYDPPTRRAEIQPAFRRLIAPDDPGGEPRAVDTPVILDVPVVFPGGREIVSVFTLFPGDCAVLMFSQRGMDGFKAALDVVAPPRSVFFEMRDAIAIPAFGPLKIVPATTSGAAIQTPDGSTSVVIEAGRVKIDAASVEVTGGSLTHNGVNVGSTHTHGNVAGGPSRTGGPG